METIFTHRCCHWKTFTDSGFTCSGYPGIKPSILQKWYSSNVKQNLFTYLLLNRKIYKTFLKNGLDRFF